MNLTKKLIRWFFSALPTLITSNAVGYDNSRPPPFDMEKKGRGYQSVSIHPDGEEWLISECSSKLHEPQSCHLLLYNLKSGQQKIFNLPAGYRYTYGKFSPSGRQILMLRNPNLTDLDPQSIQENIHQGEIAVMNSDGHNFHILPLAKNRIFNLSMSPDEKKIAYWVAADQRSPQQRSAVTNFDIREFDIDSGSDYLFAGPFHFFSGGSIQYLSEEELLINALIPNMNSSNAFDNLSKFNRSEVYRIRRGIKKIPEPEFQELANSRTPSADDRKNIFFTAQSPSFGISLVQKRLDGLTKLWRYPSLDGTYQSTLTIAGNGAYVGIVYGGAPLRSNEGERALCLFDIKNEKWLPVSPPPIEKSIPIEVRVSIQ